MTFRSKETDGALPSALQLWYREGILVQDAHLMFCNGSKTSVTVPEGVLSMESEAFYHCFGGLKLSLPMSLTKIHFLSFPQRIQFGFTELVVGELAAGYDELFRDNELEEIEIREGTTALADYVFADNHIARIEIPASVRRIGSRAFAGCEMLHEIVFKGDVPDIADDAFEDVEAVVWIPSDNPTWTWNRRCGYCGMLHYRTVPAEKWEEKTQEEETMGRQESEVIDITKYMPHKTIHYFVRDEGPDAWGASIGVKEGSLVRFSGRGEWRRIVKETVLYLESPGDRLEVYEPGAAEITEYVAYG